MIYIWFETFVTEQTELFNSETSFKIIQIIKLCHNLERFTEQRGHFFYDISTQAEGTSIVKPTTIHRISFEGHEMHIFFENLKKKLSFEFPLTEIQWIL